MITLQQTAYRSKPNSKLGINSKIAIESKGRILFEEIAGSACYKSRFHRLAGRAFLAVITNSQRILELKAKIDRFSSGYLLS